MIIDNVPAAIAQEVGGAGAAGQTWRGWQMTGVQGNTHTHTVATRGQQGDRMLLRVLLALAFAPRDSHAGICGDLQERLKSIDEECCDEPVGETLRPKHCAPL